MMERAKEGGIKMMIILEEAGGWAVAVLAALAEAPVVAEVGAEAVALEAVPLEGVVQAEIGKRIPLN